MGRERDRFTVTKILEKVAVAGSVAPGEILRVALGDGRPVALYNVDGTIHATDDRCTHGNSSLADEGFLEGHAIECGRHGGVFDVRTGAVLRAPCTVPLRRYDVVVRDGTIFLALGDGEAPDRQQS